MIYQAINTKDARANLITDDSYRFRRHVLFGIQCYGWDCWELSCGGIELDPIEDLGIPENTKRMKWTKTW